ncbi:MAG: D-alanine--D-alanine ligase [Gammaproteobacteria bacterium]|nr:MAG: D-alanine--D-alanine ligase [Gammaproteobacteria bacterium]
MLSEKQIKDLGKIAVFYGGLSSERKVSLQSGNAVYQALKSLKLDVEKIDVGYNIPEIITTKKFDRVFNMLHGKYGEDGIIQALLEWNDIPFTGAKMAASAIAMDKYRTKLIATSIGCLTPESMLIKNEKHSLMIVEKLSLPLVIKPISEGSSIGISIVKEKNQMVDAYIKALKYTNQVMAEKFVKGSEYTAAILDDTALPVIKLKAKNEFYDYEAKYESDETEYMCPCGLDQNIEKQVQNQAIKIFKAIGARHWGRADFIIDKNNHSYFIEMNTIPGMTEHSLVPMAAYHAGIDFNRLVYKIIKQTLHHD